MSKLAKNSLLYLLSTISIKATSFILLPFYTFLITPEEYGRVYVVNAFITYMSLFLSFSLGSAIQRYYFECASEKEVEKLYSSVVIMVTAISSLVIGILLFFYHPLADFLNLPYQYLFFGIITSYLSVFYPLILSLLYARQEGKRISIITLLLGVIQIITQLILVIKLPDKAFALILSLFINGLLSFFIFLFFSRPFFILFFDKIKWRLYIKYSVHQLPSDVAVWLISFSDRILLNKLKGAYDTGIYGMGSTLGQIPQILVHSINKAYVPYVFENYKRVGNDDNANLNNLIKTTTLLFSLITAFVCLLISFSNNIISFFSPQYLESGIIMVLILIAFLIDAYRIIFMNPISYNVKYVKIKSAVWMFSAIFSIGLNLILIPRYSMYGACISLLLSYSTSFLLILYFSNKAMKILYEKDKMFKVFFLSLLFALSFFVGFSILALTIKILLTIIYLYILFKILDIYPLKGIK